MIIKTKKLITLIILFTTITKSVCEGYLFGLKSYDNSISNITNIEKKYKLDIQIVAFIFDPRSEDSINIVKSLKKELPNKIYHITISPDKFSAKEVAEGKFDNSYKKLFEIIKQQDIKVIFRTMHEMNGGRYPRSGDPENFKKARIHVRELSRAEGLDQYNILFDFSSNHRDMPAKGTPSQSAELVECNQKNKLKLKCKTFEDYYPGDEYTDILGVTFYNRGKGSSDRKRINPREILYDNDWNTLTRIKKFKKPIFIDEVATTSVKYEGTFDPEKSLEIYNNVREHKNIRLRSLRTFLQSEPDIVGFCYFNTDYTNGLKTPYVGEADRPIIDIDKNKIYFGVFDLYNNGDKNFSSETLLKLFKSKIIQTDQTSIYVEKDNFDQITKLLFYFKRDDVPVAESVSKLNNIRAKIEKSKLPEYSKKKRNKIFDKTIEILQSY